MNTNTEEKKMKATSPKAESETSFRWLRNLFHLESIPAPADNQDMAMNAGKASFTPVAPRKNKTVLVVDDDPLFLKLTSTRLEAEGYDVVTAADGSEGIQAARRKKPDVVVLDVNLPQDVSGVPWDGMRLTAWLKRFDDLKHIPVVMVTAGDPSKYTRLALGAGAIAFFHKRMEPAVLLTLVNHTLARKSHNPTPSLDTNFQI
jgi:CheY-like chemotaxis protein